MDTVRLDMSTVNTTAFSNDFDCIVVTTHDGQTVEIDLGIATTLGAMIDHCYYEQDLRDKLDKDYRVDEIPPELYNAIFEAYVDNRESHDSGSGALDMWDWQTSLENAIEEFADGLADYARESIE